MKDYDLAYEVAAQVMALIGEVDRLRDENEKLKEYKRKYAELLDSSLNHGREMVGNMLQVCMALGDKANPTSTTVEEPE